MKHFLALCSPPHSIHIFRIAWWLCKENSRLHLQITELPIKHLIRQLVLLLSHSDAGSFVNNQLRATATGPGTLEGLGTGEWDVATYTI